MPNRFHYTDKDGWNAIRSQAVWRFAASKPRDPARPVGAYFTDVQPTPMTLRTLYKKIRVPKVKQAYVFWFVGSDGLSQLNGGRGATSGCSLVRSTIMWWRIAKSMAI